VIIDLLELLRDEIEGGLRTANKVAIAGLGYAGLLLDRRTSKAWMSSDQGRQKCSSNSNRP